MITKMSQIRRVLLLIFCFLVVNNVGVFSATCNVSKDCSELQYCSKYDNVCEPCSNICEVNNHNYDERRCKDDCQNYLQSKNKGEIKSLQTLVSISLALNCIIIVILAIVAVLKLLQWKKKRGVSISWIRNKFTHKEKTKPERTTAVSITTSSDKPDLRLDMPTIGMQTPSTNGNTPSTATTTLSRRPTEDNTLDYAYDNPALSSTPV